MNKFVDETLEYKPVLTKAELNYLELGEGVEALLVSSRLKRGCEEFVLMNPVIKKIDTAFLDEEKVIFISKHVHPEAPAHLQMGHVKNVPGLQGLLVEFKKTEARKAKEQNLKPKAIQYISGYVPVGERLTTQQCVNTNISAPLTHFSGNEEIIEQLKLASVYGNLPPYLINLLHVAAARLEDFQVQMEPPILNSEELDRIFPSQLQYVQNSHHRAPVLRMVKIVSAEVTNYFSTAGVLFGTSELGDLVLVVKSDQHGEIISREIKRKSEIKELQPESYFGYPDEGATY